MYYTSYQKVTHNSIRRREIYELTSTNDEMLIGTTRTPKGAGTGLDMEAGLEGWRSS